MADVIWERIALQARIDHIKESEFLFGPMTAIRFSEEIDKTIDYLRKYPETGFIEPLLTKKKVVFRAFIFKKRFKIIYHYDTTNDILIITDIWDTKRNPITLKKRIH